MNDLEKAKEIFRSHVCSHFIIYTDSEDLLSQYLSYNGDKNIELEWTREYILEQFDELNDKNVIGKMYNFYRSGIYRFNDLMIKLCDEIEKLYLNIDDSKIDKTIILLKLFQIMGKSKDVDIIKKTRIIMLKIMLTIDESKLSRHGLNRYIDIKREIID